MTNGEKYKGAKERADAFWNWNKGFNLPYDAVESFAKWLGLEAEAEEPLPCPFCGSSVMIVDKNLDLKWRVECPIVDCRYTSGICDSKEHAIAAHNRVARAAKEASHE